MRCECGYDFAMNAPAKDREYDSFLLVHDRDFQKYIRLEVKAAQCSAAKDKEGARRALNQSFKYSGTVNICPRCGCLNLWRNGMDEVGRYLPTATSTAQNT